MAKDLPINLRIVEQLAKATIKNIADAIVELITNSDDSFRRLEDKGNKVEGAISIYVNRKKGGICEKLLVKDFAEGMTNKELEKAIEFGGETSGFETGRTVRGMFGRGLKETIIALGEGEIKTVKDGKLCRTKLWFNKKEKKPQYDDELLNNIQDTPERNGTEIDIKITNEKIKIPEYDMFKEQLPKHYALRDIMSNTNRKIELIFDDLKRKRKCTSSLTFSCPEGKKVFEKEINIPGYEDIVKLTIYESPIPLDFKRYDPYGLAGILIKTKGATLDNQLFKFETDPTAFYFFGEAICEGLEERLRKDEVEIIDFNRAGLEWRHEYCQKIREVIEEALEPFVFKKRQELEKKPEKEVRQSTKKMLENLAKLLNKLAKLELEELGEFPEDPGPDITNLLIKPEVANLQKDKPRVFSIYAPTELVTAEGAEAHIKSDNMIHIQPLASTVKLERHPKYPEKIFYRYFKVVGKTENETGIITVTLGKEKALAKVTVAPASERNKRRKITARKGGFITDIKPDSEEFPYQRTFYDRDTGIVKIFVNFPSVAKFIKSGFEGTETLEGKILLAELVGEAFFRELARRKLEISPPSPGGEIDAFNDEVNKMQKNHLHQIQDLIFSWKFK